MYPEIFGVIKSYGLMLAISFGLGLWLSIRRGRPHGLSPDAITDLVFGVLVSSLVGVRAAYVLTHLGEFHPWYRSFYIWDGGLTLYGGIILATVTVAVMARRRAIPFLLMADVFSPGVMLGIGLTRIGCFMAGCCFGHPTSCGLGVVFPDGAPAWKQFGSVPVQPSQLYASAAGFLIFGLLLLAEKWSHPRGATFGRFLLLYGISRFSVDFTRYYEPEQVMALGWSNNQWLSVGLMLGGLVIIVAAARGLWDRGTDHV